ncbi:MAG: DUF3467 domain-containing protein [bacterium]
MSQNPPPRTPAPQFQVELPDEVAEGQYSNLMFVTHSPSEFVLDFARALPGVRKGKVYARVVMTPQHAKAFQELLERNLSAFEDKHGTIKLPGRDENTPIGFAPTSPVAPHAASDAHGA